MVIPDDSMRPIEAMQKTGRALSRKDIRAVDVIVGKETVFNQRKGLPTTERAIARDEMCIRDRHRDTHVNLTIWLV